MNKTYKVICSQLDAPEIPVYVAAEFTTEAEARSYAELAADCQSAGSHAIYTVEAPR